MKTDFTCFFRSFLKHLEEKTCVAMAAVGYNIPEAARLHIRISDSDDDSDGEQVEDKIRSRLMPCLHVESIIRCKSTAKVIFINLKFPFFNQLVTEHGQS